MGAMRALGDRGFARELLHWEWRGVQLEAAIARCRYYVRGERHEAVAWCELRELGGARRVEVGTFADVAAAKAACERDVAHRLRRDVADRGVDVRIAPPRQRKPVPVAKPVRPQPVLSERERRAFDAAMAGLSRVLADE